MGWNDRKMPPDSWAEEPKSMKTVLKILLASCEKTGVTVRDKLKFSQVIWSTHTDSRSLGQLSILAWEIENECREAMIERTKHHNRDPFSQILEFYSKGIGSGG